MGYQAAGLLNADTCDRLLLAGPAILRTQRNVSNAAADAPQNSYPSIASTNRRAMNNVPGRLRGRIFWLIADVRGWRLP